MQSLDAAGERAAAIQHARIHGTLLENEVGISSDPEIVAFAERLRATDHRSTAPAQGGAVSPKGPPLIVAMDREPMTSGEDELGRVSFFRPVWWVAPIVVVAAIVTFWFARHDAARGTESPTRSIAVLPFANLSPSRDDEFFSDGITEELISTLAKVSGIAVASRTSSFAYKNHAADVRDVGRSLGVATVVEGSVRRSGETFRVTARLVDASTGRPIWSDAYDRRTADILAVQEELSRAIVSKLTGTLLGAGGVSLPEEATQDPAAYELYLKGRFAWHQRTEQGLREAVEYFGQAVARAPGYARAFVGLADAYAVSAFYDYRAPGEAYPKAEAAAQNALRIDPTLAAPHATLGYIRTYYDLDWPRAEEEFKRAIALDAGYSTAHQWYANLLTVAGRFSEAEREMRVAQEADPLSLIANAALGWTFYYAGRFEAALEQSRKTLALNPNFELAHLWGGWSLEAMGRREEARSWITEAVRLSHGSVLPRLALAYVLARSASPAAKDSARAIAQEIERFHAAGTYVPSYEVGKLHLALGDRSTALQWLERAYAERSHSRAFARVDPQLALLRGDPRWMRLIDGTGR
jgi:TolB-like protein/Tfp pilus assembly protein PilF